jgi:hypothetical protein
MSIFRMLKVTEPTPAADGEPGERNIRLNRREDMDMVRAFVAVLRDDPDSARDIVRDMPPRDRALLSFTLEEMTRVVSEQEDFRRMEDRRAAREARETRRDTDE